MPEKAPFTNINLDTNPVETRIARVYRDDKGVIIINMKDIGEVDEFDVMDMNLVIRHLAQHKMALKMLIATADFDLTKRAKEMAQREDNISKTAARAIVVSNKIKASVFNFLRQFNAAKKYPQQFFDSESEAYEWLLKQSI